MDALVREQIRRWKAAMDADNERALEEKRCRTPSDRLRLLQAFLDSHGRIVISRSNPQSRELRLSNSEVQERLRDQYPKHNIGIENGTSRSSESGQFTL